MVDHEIDSSDSEWAFNEFIDDQLKDSIDELVNNIDSADIDVRGGEVIVETDGIEPPTFVYGNKNGDDGQGNAPGDEAGKMKFGIPFDRFMDLVKDSLNLPNLTKKGDGNIKEEVHVFKSISKRGSLIDRRRTFKRAIKTSISTGQYNPKEGKKTVLIYRRDRRYRSLKTITRPKFRAVVHFINDVSYSTSWNGRLDLEKRVVSFIQAWIEYNYGKKNVEHRFYVHDAGAHEVSQDEFYDVRYGGGTSAAPAFKMVTNIAKEEYNLETTNHYMFYFGDGELFGDDAKQIAKILNTEAKGVFNRVGITEVKPEGWSTLVATVDKEVSDPNIRTAICADKKDTVKTIKKIFSDHVEEDAKDSSGER